MAYVAAIAAVAGAAVSAYGAVKQGQATKEANEYNAQIAEQNAAAAKKKAAYDAETSALEWKQLLGKQAALYSKAGVDISSGSPLLTMSFQAEQAERDRQAILYEGKTSSESALSQASLFRFYGSNASAASTYSATSSLLSSLANTYTSSKTTGTTTNNYYY